MVIRVENYYFHIISMKSIILLLVIQTAFSILRRRSFNHGKFKPEEIRRFNPVLSKNYLELRSIQRPHIVEGVYYFHGSLHAFVLLKLKEAENYSVRTDLLYGFKTINIYDKVPEGNPKMTQIPCRMFNLDEFETVYNDVSQVINGVELNSYEFADKLVSKLCNIDPPIDYTNEIYLKNLWS